MKKISIIILLIIIAISVSIFCFNKNNKQKTTEENYDEKIKEYISQIYGNMYVLPEFNNINEANEEWLWDNLITYINRTKKLESIYYTKEELTNFSKELYGTQLNKSFPEEGSEFIFTDEETGKYIIGGYGLDYISSFTLNSTRCIKNNLFEAIILEYQIDLLGILKGYEDLGPGSAYDLYNLKNEKIEQFDSTYNNIFERINKYVTENKTQFTEKKLILELDKNNDRFYIISSKRI